MSDIRCFDCRLIPEEVVGAPAPLPANWAKLCILLSMEGGATKVDAARYLCPNCYNNRKALASAGVRV